MGPTRLIFLALVGGVLLGCSYPPFETGMLAAAGFVPLFLLLSDAGTYGTVFRRAYGMFFVFNLITLYWPGGFVHGQDPYLMLSGALLLLVHPVFMSLPVLAWHSIRKSGGLAVAVASFPLLWVAFEYLHSSTQLSFPWLTLGNTQTYDLRVIQIASVTGVYGISFWLLWLNVLLWFLFVAFSEGRRRTAGYLLAATIGVYALPIVAEPPTRAPEMRERDRWIDIALIQPNIDPFDKWRDPPAAQLGILDRMTDSAVEGRKTDLVIWPETAIPFFILSPDNARQYATLRSAVDRIGVPILSGIPDMVVYPGSVEAPRGAKTSPGGVRYETFNSAALFIPGTDTVPRFAKTLLVPFAERVPYSDVLSFLNAAQWNFGMGGWAIGRDTALIRVPVAGGEDVPVGNLVCYESVYPAYVAGLVRRGAEFLTVITNDSWWGRTSGAYQHRQFAVLRAVETGRWVVQCANGGITFAIDPAGRISGETDLFERTALRTRVGLSRAVTPYVRHGDLLAEACLSLSVIGLFSVWMHRFVKHRLEEQR